MIPLELSKEADADLADILYYGLLAFGADTAEAYLKSFEDAFDLIRRHPKIGAEIDIIRPPTRSLSHRSHRIFYDVFAEQVVVQRVLHAAMDVETSLG